MTDSLGDRMKRQYEDRTRYMLPRRTWTVIRCDGKSFSSFTRGCLKPFDGILNASMVHAATALCVEAQGAKIGYVQSDEISVVLGDFDSIETEAWFDGNVQKIASVAAATVTAVFNCTYRRGDCERLAVFDARVFTVPDPIEAENYLIWRQKDAIRNSISGLAQAHFSATQLHGKSQVDMLAMLLDVGVSWSEQPFHVQRGVGVRRVVEMVNGAERSRWAPDFGIPIFTEQREYIEAITQIAPSTSTAKEQ